MAEHRHERLVDRGCRRRARLLRDATRALGVDTNWPGSCETEVVANLAADTISHDLRLALALDSFEGLSVGDGLGERFFWPVWDGGIKAAIGVLPPHPWWWTDDTNMAASIVEVLAEHRGVDQDRLAASFLARYERWRGYGPAMGGYFEDLTRQVPWRDAAQALFNGTGSAGNGAAMRVAPLGAYWAGDVPRAVSEAAASAEVTHAHPEGISGAIAVSVAACLAASDRESSAPGRAAFLEAVADHVPPSKVRDGLMTAARFRGSPAAAAGKLGNGSACVAPDTVPFALWCAAGSLDDYERALWATVAGWGDVDTTCAISGGVVAARVGTLGIPAEWRKRREPLPDWVPTSA